MLPKINHVFRIHTKKLRFTQSGSEILSLNVVASSKYKTKQGEEREDVCWIKATAFGNTAKAIDTYFNEKDRIFITGELKQESWTMQDGSKRSQHTIKIDGFDFIEKRDSQGQNNQQQSQHAQPQQQSYHQSNQGGYGNQPQQGQQPNQGYGSQQPPSAPEIDIDDESIPF